MEELEEKKNALGDTMGRVTAGGYPTHSTCATATATLTSLLGAEFRPKEKRVERPGVIEVLSGITVGVDSHTISLQQAVEIIVFVRSAVPISIKYPVKSSVQQYTSYWLLGCKFDSERTLTTCAFSTSNDCLLCCICETLVTIVPNGKAAHVNHPGDEIFRNNVTDAVDALKAMGRCSIGIACTVG